MPNVRTNRSSGEVISASDLNALATAVNTLLTGTEFSDAASARIGAMVAAAGGSYNSTTKQITLPGVAIDNANASDTKTYSSNKILQLQTDQLSSTAFGKAARDQAGGMIAGAGGTYNATAGTITLPASGGGLSVGGTAAALRVPYRDPSNNLVWTAANSVVASALGWVIITDPDYGAADPTGGNKTATKAAITAAVAAVPVGGTLYAPAGTFAWDGAIAVKTVGISITGPSATWAGAFHFGDNTGTGGASMARIQMGATVHQTTFSKALDKTTYTVKGYADGSYFIGLDRVRDVQIIDVNFYGAAWPVWVKPNPNCAEHDLSAINVYDSIFDECDIAFYAQFDPASPGSWLCLADSNFERNTINKSYQYAYYAQGLDGGQVRGNTCFMLNYKSNGNPRFGEKQNNFRWDYAAWLHVNDNACFEAGREAVLIDHVRYVSMCGNHFAWPGQVVPSDAVRIISNSGGAYATNEYAQIAFTGNLGSYYSKSFLSVVGDVGSLATGGNACLFDREADRFVGTAGQFTGTTAAIQTARRTYLDNYAHYRFDLSAVTNLTAAQTSIPEAVLIRSEARADGSISYVHLDRLPGAHAAMTAVQSFAPFAGNSGGFLPAVTFTASTIKSVLQLRGMADNFSTYSGMVVVTARSTTGSNKESSYVLHVAKTAAGGLFVNVISALGYTAGAAADDPSFEWSLESNGLRAKPLGLTAGAFLFAPLSSGNLTVG